MKFFDSEKIMKEKRKKKSELDKNSKQKQILASNREKLLMKIKAKEKKRKENRLKSPKINNESKDKEKEKSNLEKIKKDKEILSKKAKEKKRSQIEVKSKNSARDNLKNKIKELEKQISSTKYNKKTQGAIGLMKAQLSQLKLKLSTGSGKQGKKEEGYSVRKSGDASVVLLGFPSAGKSTLLNKLTGTESETAAYAFTTLTCIPGMLKYKHAKIQILDVPGIVEGAASGSGRGKEVLQVVRNADLILILIDANSPAQKKKILKEVWESNVRLDKKKPDVKIRRKSKDGLDIGRTVLTPEIDDDTIISILKQFRIMNADILIRDPINADDLIDVLEGNKTYTPSLTIISKEDLLNQEQKELIKEELKPDLFISAQKNEGIEQLKEIIFNKLTFIRIYLKEIGKKPDMEEPMIMRKGQTIKDLCLKLHKDFLEKFKYARLWGPSAKFDGQITHNLKHIIQDEDIVEIHIK